jgi:hypothetical protein
VTEIRGPIFGTVCWSPFLVQAIKRSQKRDRKTVPFGGPHFYTKTHNNRTTRRQNGATVARNAPRDPTPDRTNLAHHTATPRGFQHSSTQADPRQCANALQNCAAKTNKTNRAQATRDAIGSSTRTKPKEAMVHAPPLYTPTALRRAALTSTANIIMVQT